MALAAFSANLEHYIKGEAFDKIPVWQMISAETGGIKKRAESWKKSMKIGEVIQSQSMVGGGSLPGETLPTWVWAIDHDHPQKILASLREGSPVVIGRIDNDQVVFDPRTILPQFDKAFVGAVKNIMEK